MSQQKNHFFAVFTIGIIGVCVIALLYIALGQNPKKVASALLGKQMPAFELSTLQKPSIVEYQPGETFSSAEFKGRPLLINFWASWCVSCRQEAQELERLHRHFKDDLLVVGIAIQDTKELAMSFARRYGKTYLLGLDNSGDASIEYGVIGVPESFLVDKTGKIVHKISGPITLNEITELVRELKLL